MRYREAQGLQLQPDRIGVETDGNYFYRLVQPDSLTNFWVLLYKIIQYCIIMKIAVDIHF